MTWSFFKRPDADHKDPYAETRKLALRAERRSMGLGSATLVINVVALALSLLAAVVAIGMARQPKWQPIVITHDEGRHIKAFRGFEKIGEPSDEIVAHRLEEFVRWAEARPASETQFIDNMRRADAMVDVAQRNFWRERVEVSEPDRTRLENKTIFIVEPRANKENDGVWRVEWQAELRYNDSFVKSENWYAIFYVRSSCFDEPDRIALRPFCIEIYDSTPRKID